MRLDRITATVAVLLLAASGCGDDSGDPEVDAETLVTKPEMATPTSPSTTSEQGARPSDDSSPSSAREKPLGTVTINGRRYRKVKSPSGAVSLLPRRPMQTTVLPERGCRAKRFRSHDGSSVRRFLPPAPGLRAERTSEDLIVISYWFGKVDQRCRPRHLSFVADVNDDSLPPAGDSVRLRRLQGSIEFELPESVRAADVVRATARTAEGLPSNSSAVLIG